MHRGSCRLRPAPIVAAAVAGLALTGAPAGISPARGSDERRAEQIQVPPPPFSEGVYPCSDCHTAGEANQTRRPVPEHEQVILSHDPDHLWCFDCHNLADRDSLRLASGEKVPFTESWRLCRQCHGEKARDWKAGVHGKRTGFWDGKKQYLLCAHCHDPHSPRFKPLRPEPAPVRPDRIRP